MSSQKKQKIIGALMLIALLAIFIPLFLSSRSDTPNMRSKPPQAPPMPTINLKIPPMPKDAADQHQPAAMQATQQKLAAPVIDAQPVTNNWRLKLGTFVFQKNSKHLIHLLKQKGFEAYSQLDHNSKGKLVYQVYIGPAVGQVEATQLQKHLLHKMGMASMIVAYPADKN